MNQRNISYALAKQVPEMTRGFAISTNYGDIVIEAGWMADQIAKQVEIALRCELLALDNATPVTVDGHGFSQVASVTDESCERRPAGEPTDATFYSHCGAPLTSRAVDLPLGSTLLTDGGRQ